MVAAVELAVYRLAVPGLKPTDPNDSPPIWHTALSYGGLFLSYFGSVLAFGVVLRQLVLLGRGDHPFWRPAAHAMVVSGSGFAFYAARSLIGAPTELDTLLLEFFFSATLVLLVAAELKRGGDVAVKIGLLFLAAPLLVHFCRDAGVKWVLGDEALVKGLPERIAAYGQWSMVLAALLSPYFFAPRPFIRSAGRLAPLAMGMFVVLVGALVMRQSAEVGVKIASDGLGVDLGSVLPSGQIALYLLALGSITWTLMACFLSPSPARRRIGVGLGLVAAAGYGFDWPLQYLAGFVGFLTIGAALFEVVREESGVVWSESRYHPPPIEGEVWQAYVVALVQALRGRGMHAQAVSVEEPAGEAAGTVARTHVLVLEGAPVPVRLLIERTAGVVRSIEISCGRDPGGPAGAPAWTLEARPAHKLAMVVHPPPPETDAPLARTGDPEFDRRFRMRDAGGHGERLFDEGQRARATALLDGWLALWPRQSLVYRVMPGYGAPRDNPIPSSDLAFRGAIWDGAVDRLVTVIEFLVQLAGRAFAAPEAPAEAAPGAPEAPAGAAPGAADDAAGPEPEEAS